MHRDLRTNSLKILKEHYTCTDPEGFCILLKLRKEQEKKNAHTGALGCMTDHRGKNEQVNILKQLSRNR